MYVKIICCEPSVVFDGEWREEDTAEDIVEYALTQARAWGIPLHLEIKGLGIWSIAPNGKIVKGALFDCTRMKS